MIKVVMPSSFNFDQQVMSLIDVHSRGVDSCWLKKTAAVLTKEMSEIRPDPNFTFVHLIALGDGETYGCFFEGAPVQTISGLKPIEQVQVGDLALTHKNRYRKVTQTFESAYEGEAVSIKCAGLPVSIECTPNHPWHAVKADKLTDRIRFDRRQDGGFSEYVNSLVDSAAWTAAKDIGCGDYLIVPCAPELETVETRPPEYDPYVVGLYIAEGCLSREYKDISTKGVYKEIVFTVSDKDEESIEYTLDWLESIGRDRVAIRPSYTSEHGRRFEVGFSEFAQWLDIKFGHLAITKHLDPSVFSWSETDKLRLIAGYIDGDGCIHHNEDKSRYLGTITCSTASLNLALDMQRLIASLGLASSVNKCTNRVANGCFGHKDFPIYQLSIGSCVSNRLLQHTLRIKPHGKETKRVGGACQVSGKYMLCPVRSVTRAAIEPTIKYNLEVAEDNSYVVMAQGHNSNRNADYLPKATNSTCHDTFVKFGKWYHNHRNKPARGDKIYGHIKASAYNGSMGRVELIVAINNKDDAQNIEKLARGEDVPVSMALTEAFDLCSACGHKAKNESERCDCLRKNAGQLTTDGRQICMINPPEANIKFFDISAVSKNADRIAFTLRKVAGVEPVQLSTDLAKFYGLVEPADMVKDSIYAKQYATLQKLAKLEKEIEGEIKANPALCTVADGLNAPVSENINNIPDDKLTAALGKLASDRVSLSLPDFYRLALGPRFSEVEYDLSAAQACLPGVFAGALKTAEDFLSGVKNYEPIDAPLPVLIKNTLNKVGQQSSLLGDQVRRRVAQATLRKSAGVFVPNKLLQPTSEIGRILATEYARYKLAALVKIEDEAVVKLAVLQDFGN